MTLQSHQQSGGSSRGEIPAVPRNFQLKSVPGKDEEFRRFVKKLPGFRIPRPIFFKFRASANPDDPPPNESSKNSMISKKPPNFSRCSRFSPDLKNSSLTFLGFPDSREPCFCRYRHSGTLHHHRTVHLEQHFIKQSVRDAAR